MTEIVDIVMGNPDLFARDRSLYRQVPNLAFTSGEEVVTTDQRWMDLAKYRLPDRGEAFEYYILEGRSVDAIEVTMETSRGCPSNRCIACTIKQCYGGNWRPFAIEEVIKRIRIFAQSGRTIFRIIDSQFAGPMLTDNEFLASMQRLEDFARGVMQINADLELEGERRIRIVVFASRVDAFYEQQESPQRRARRNEVLGLLAQAGVEKVLIGAESGSDERLQWHRKGITVAQMREAVARIRSHGIRVEAEFI